MRTSPTIAGIYPPVPTFFDEGEDLDLATLREHLKWLKAAGISNIVALGSNGEAMHLAPDERQQVIATIREAMGAEAQVLAGVGDNSTRAT
ncbi:MAG TPA: dihydrodipicolinate synthase family protein, partial [Ktedonobacterales bacterium]|nr:dihydrodipicolinate synthase family protein [Ktedonobacterales bacterium]